MSARLLFDCVDSLTLSMGICCVTQRPGRDFLLYNLLYHGVILEQ